MHLNLKHSHTAASEYRYFSNVRTWHIAFQMTQIMVFALESDRVPYYEDARVDLSTTAERLLLSFRAVSLPAANSSNRFALCVYASEPNPPSPVYTDWLPAQIELFHLHSC